MNMLSRRSMGGTGAMTMTNSATTTDTSKSSSGIAPVVSNLSKCVLISDAEFDVIFKEIKAIEGNESKLSRLEEMKIPYLFSSAQLLQTVEVTSSIKTKLAIISIIGPRLSDPKSGMEELKLKFRFVEEQERVESILKQRIQQIKSSSFSSVRPMPMAGGRGIGIGIGGGGRGCMGRGSCVGLGLVYSSAGSINSSSSDGDIDIKTDDATNEEVSIKNEKEDENEDIATKNRSSSIYLPTDSASANCRRNGNDNGNDGRRIYSSSERQLSTDTTPSKATRTCSIFLSFDYYDGTCSDYYEPKSNVPSTPEMSFAAETANDTPEVVDEAPITSSPSSSLTSSPSYSSMQVEKKSMILVKKSLGALGKSVSNSGCADVKSNSSESTCAVLTKEGLGGGGGGGNGDGDGKEPADCNISIHKDKNSANIGISILNSDDSTSISTNHFSRNASDSKSYSTKSPYVSSTSSVTSSTINNPLSASRVKSPVPALNNHIPQKISPVKSWIKSKAVDDELQASCNTSEKILMSSSSDLKDISQLVVNNRHDSLISESNKAPMRELAEISPGTVSARRNSFIRAGPSISPSSMSPQANKNRERSFLTAQQSPIIQASHCHSISISDRISNALSPLSRPLSTSYLGGMTPIASPVLVTSPMAFQSYIQCSKGNNNNNRHSNTLDTGSLQGSGLVSVRRMSFMGGNSNVDNLSVASTSSSSSSSSFLSPSNVNCSPNNDRNSFRNSKDSKSNSPANHCKLGLGNLFCSVDNIYCNCSSSSSSSNSNSSNSLTINRDLSLFPSTFCKLDSSSSSSSSSSRSSNSSISCSSSSRNNNTISILNGMTTSAMDILKSFAKAAQMEPSVFLSLEEEVPLECVSFSSSLYSSLSLVSGGRGGQVRNLYSYRELLRRNFKKDFKDIDPVEIEFYLIESEFLQLFGMSKESYLQVPKWKQINQKKALLLF